MTRGWFVVARLTKRLSDDSQSPEYEFVYVAGAQSAAKHGFRPFLAFPEIEQVLRSHTLLPFFGNRLMPRSRPEYPAYVAQLGLAPAPDEFAILARSGGQRVTERSEIEVFAPPTQRPDGKHETFFFVRAMRYVRPREETLAQLKDGDQLFCMLDVQNTYNPKAVALRTKDQSPIGYIPNYLCNDVFELLQRHCEVRISVAKANPPTAPLQNRLLCHFEAQFPPDLRPLSGPDFTPLSDNAWALLS